MIPRPRLKLLLLPLFALLAGPTALEAQSDVEGSFQGYVQLLAAQARSEGVSEASIQRLTWGLTYNPRVVELDRGQPGISPVPPPVAPYIAQHVDAARIAGGRNMYDNVANLLPRTDVHRVFVADDLMNVSMALRMAALTLWLVFGGVLAAPPRPLLELDGFIDWTGAITVLHQGDFVDPYFALQALLLAQDNGLDITPAADKWIAWLLVRQKPDATFDRFCQSGQLWLGCKSSDADDAVLAM